MALGTKPIFYYVSEVDNTNFRVDFVEPNESPLERTAELRVGGRSLTQLATELQRALNDTGELDYTVTVDRDARTFIISASDIFELNVASGSNLGTTAFSLLGFTGSDRTGLSSYESDTAIGFTYSPQFPLQDYLPSINNVEGIEPSVNESADGTIEIVTFGNRSFVEFDIRYISETTKSPYNPSARNPNALSEIRSFMDFLILRQPIEFMEDIADRSVFETLQLERTRSSRLGVGYEIKEERGLQNYFTTGLLRFRKVD